MDKATTDALRIVAIALDMPDGQGPDFLRRVATKLDEQRQQHQAELDDNDPILWLNQEEMQ